MDDTNDVVPVTRELREALVGAEADRSSAPGNARTTLRGQWHSFDVRLEFRRHSANGDLNAVGRAVQTYIGPHLPRSGEYLTGIGPWGERPLTDHVRVLRVEVAPVPLRGGLELSSFPKTTVVATCVLDSTTDTTITEHGLRRDGWSTKFV